MEIDSIDKLIEAENQIRLLIQQYKLDEVLVGLREASDKLQPFVVGGISLFAVRYCTAGYRTKTTQPLDWSSLAPLADLVTQYLIADPLGFDPDIQQDFHSSNPVFTMLRIAGNQMPYAVNLFGQYARPLMLFHEIPNKLKGRNDIRQFDFEANFLKLNGVR